MSGTVACTDCQDGTDLLTNEVCGSCGRTSVEQGEPAAGADDSYTGQIATLRGMVRRLTTGWWPSDTVDHPTKWHNTWGLQGPRFEPMTAAEAEILREIQS